MPVNTFYRRQRRLLQGLYGEKALPHFGVGLLRATFAQRFVAKDDPVSGQHALGHRRITSTFRFFGRIEPINPDATT